VSDARYLKLASDVVLAAFLSTRGGRLLLAPDAPPPATHRGHEDNDFLRDGAVECARRGGEGGGGGGSAKQAKRHDGHGHGKDGEDGFRRVGRATAVAWELSVLHLQRPRQPQPRGKGRVRGGPGSGRERGGGGGGASGGGLGAWPDADFSAHAPILEAFAEGRCRGLEPAAVVWKGE